MVPSLISEQHAQNTTYHGLTGECAGFVNHTAIQLAWRNGSGEHEDNYSTRYLCNILQCGSQ